MEYSPEKKICQMTGKEFEIRAEDKVFYEKMNLPLPTFSPEERLKRRMNWRNERSLYKRTCAATGKNVISCFSPESGIKVYERDYWWSDAWEPRDYGRDYDFSKPFFQQFRELLDSVPMCNLFASRNIDSSYVNHAGECKNCHLSFGMWGDENVSYAAKTVRARDSFDIYWGNDSELCYELVNSQKCYQSKYLVDCNSVNNSEFLFDCHGCSHCFMSSNLRNKMYVFQNEQLTKEEYQKKLSEVDFGSYDVVTRLVSEFRELSKKAVHKYTHFTNVEDSVGDYLIHCSNCFRCFDLEEGEDCAYLTSGGLGLKDCHDAYGIGSAELLFEVVDSGIEASQFISTINCWGGHSVSYAYTCHNSEYLLGCVGIRKGQHCILNKQYTKAEYEELVPKIIQHMKDMPYVDSKGRTYGYGEFFPAELSPFAYNETLAQEYFPTSKEELLEQGLRWYDKQKSEYNVSITTDRIPDNIDDVDESILNEILECSDKDKEYSPGAFRLTAEEFQFYKRMRIPIPRKAPDPRYYDRLKLRNPMKLWKRTTEDGVEVLTSYAPDRPEKIYSDKGYQDLVL